MSPSLRVLRPFLAAAWCAAAALAQAQPVAGDVRTAKIYDLGELATPVGPELVLQAPGANAPPAPAAGGDVVIQAAGAAPAAGPAAGAPAPAPVHHGTAVIAQMVRAFVQPALLANEDVQPLGERWLVLLGRAEQHAWLERYLAAARKQRDELLNLDCELFAMPEMVFAETVVPALVQPGKAAVPGGPVILAPGAGTDAFRAALKRDPRCEVLTSPRLVVRPLMAAQVSQMQQTAYVRDFEIEVAKASFIANPIIDVVQDGVSVEAAATVLQEGITGVSLQVSVSDLKRPIPVFTTSLGGSTLPVQIQLPQVLSTQMRAAVELQRGQTVVLPLPAVAGKRHLLLLTVQ